VAHKKLTVAKITTIRYINYMSKINELVEKARKKHGEIVPPQKMQKLGRGGNNTQRRTVSVV